MKDQNNKQDITIAVLSEKVDRIEATLVNYDTNHFPSIEKRFNGIENKLAYYAGGITIVGAVANILISKFL